MVFKEKLMINIVKNRKIFFSISSIILLLSVFAIFFFGMRLSIDFTGGDLYELQAPYSKQELASKLNNLGLNNYSLREAGDKNKYILRTKPLTEKQKQDLMQEFNDINAEILRASSVGPSISGELKKKAIVAIILTSLAIIAFVAWAFKEVSRPVSSWKYGFVAILALIHDILIPVAVFAALGYLYGAEIDTLFVMALLAILGYSVNDTIVIFDRVRERLRRNKEKKIKESFEETVEKALQSTITRSINTSLTTAIVLLALYLFGADSTKYFALTLLAGVIAGTYSSIFLAAPILVEVANRFPEKEKDETEEKANSKVQ